MQTTPTQKAFIQAAHENTTRTNDAMRVLSSRDAAALQQLASEWGIGLGDDDTRALLDGFEHFEPTDPRPKAC